MYFYLVSHSVLMHSARPSELPEDDGRDEKATGVRAASYKMLKNKVCHVLPYLMYQSF